MKICVLGMLCTLVACGGETEPSDAGPDVGPIGELAVDGFLLMATGEEFFVFDPEAALTSAPVEGAVLSQAAISPDGLHVAYRTSDRMGIGLAEVSLRADGPYIVPQFQVAVPAVPESLRWSSDGLHLFYQSGGVDVATQRAWECANAASPGAAALIPVPGGSRVICGEDFAILEGGERVGAAFSDGPVSRDGQFQSIFPLTGVADRERVMTSLPSGVSRDVEGFPFPELAPTEGGALTASVEGDFRRVPAGVHGEYVQRVDMGLRVSFTRVTNLTEPVPSLRVPAAQAFQTGAWPEPVSTSFAGLLERFNAGVGRYYTPAGRVGGRQFMLVESHEIEADGPVLTEVPVEQAFLTLADDGTLEGFLASEVERVEVESNVPNIPRERSFVSLGGEDYLAWSPRSLQWGGRVSSEPWLTDHRGRVSRDGRWLLDAEIGSGFVRPCLLRVGERVRRCGPTTTGGDVVGIVGQGLKSTFAAQGPRVLGVSRTAAWDGSEVVVFGVGFGTEGTMFVGDAAVPDSAIVSWSDRRIVFELVAALPDRGEVRVGADENTGPTRAFTLHRTQRVLTPIDELPTRVELGQGLNVVDVEASVGSRILEAEPRLVLDPRLRTGDGRAMILAPGVAEAHVEEYTVEVGPFRRLGIFVIQPRSADASRWQPITAAMYESGSVSSAFGQIAGDLMTVNFGPEHFMASGEVVLTPAMDSRGPGMSELRGLPEFHRERTDGQSAWVIIADSGSAPQVRLLVGFDLSDARWGAHRFASPAVDRINGLLGVESAGDRVLFVGRTEFDLSGAQFSLSDDAGATRETVDVPGLDDRGGLLAPIRVPIDDDFVFLVFDGTGGTHLIELDGTIHIDAANAISGVLPSLRRTSNAPDLQFAATEGEVRVYLSGRVMRLDVRAALDAARAMSTAPEWAAAGPTEVVSFFRDAERGDVLLVDAEGGTWRASGERDAPFEPFDVALQSELQAPVIRALARMPDGRLIASTTVPDVDGERHPVLRGSAVVLAAPPL